MKAPVFISDNCSCAHPDVMDALIQVNNGYVTSYGHDEHTQNAINLFKDYFGDNIEVFFVANGTAANTLSIKTLIRSYDALICSESAHLNENESGAIEAIAGSKLISVKSVSGKLNCDSLKEKMKWRSNPYLPQPKLITLSQATELGTVYSIEELDAIKNIAKENKLFLYMDGARLANAAAYLGVSLKKICTGFDAVFFGGTKNGGMFGEAIIFFNLELAKHFKCMQKQNLQLMPKTRFIAAQYIALLKNDLWLRNAQISNLMAKILAHELSSIDEIKILYSIEANMVFAQMSPQIINNLLEKIYLSVVDGEAGIIRLVTSFDTKKEDILFFTSLIKSLIR